jgi:hypothetical protein
MMPGLYPDGSRTKEATPMKITAKMLYTMHQKM